MLKLQEKMNVYQTLPIFNTGKICPRRKEKKKLFKEKLRFLKHMQSIHFKVIRKSYFRLARNQRHVVHSG